MKKAAITGKKQAEIIDVPDLKARDEWVVVKVHAAPMCAEYKGFLNGWKDEHLGHEAAGEVVEVAQSGPYKVGDRVVAMPLMGCGGCESCLSGEFIYCENWPDFEDLHGSRSGTGTMAQYILKQPLLLAPIPDDVSYEKGSLACCGLGPSFGAMEEMNVNAFDTILITGLGPVGFGAIINAKYRGANVIAVESHPWRVQRAKEMDVTVLDPQDADILQQIKDLTDGRGVDCALDCSGAVPAERLCIDAARRRGRVAFIGENNTDLPIRVSDDLIRKGLKVMGSWHYNLADYPRVLEIIRNSPYIDKLISHVMPMSEIQEAFEVSASHDCAKIILKPWE